VSSSEPDSSEPHDKSARRPPPDSDGVAEEPQRRQRAASLPVARRRARVLALQALYEADVSGHDPAVTIERLLENEAVQEETARFARWLVVGVKENHAAVDDRIRGSATQWPVEQLAVVDRNILRIAIYEMLIENETPVRVAVNEAVELAKAFGADASPRFVNGVLGALSAQASE
jgi:N utilization substance protein B